MMRFFRCGTITLACGCLAFLIMGVWSATAMSQTAKWYNMARAALDSDPGQVGALEAGKVCVEWSKGKNWKPTREYHNVFAEIAERLGAASVMADNDKQARKLALAKGK